MFSFKNEGEEDYRVQRKMFQQYFNKEKSREYRGIQTREARLLAQALLSSPGGHKAAILRFSAAVIIDITYGHQVTESRDPYLQIADECCRLLNENGPPGATPVDFFPILRHFPSWFPGTYYANFARASAKSHRKLIEYPVSKVTEQMANGTARQSFLSFHLDAMRDQGLADDAAYLEQIKATSAIVYVAGTETVQARKEIDSVIGPDRLPEFEDREKLPYLESILQEVNRWNHAVPSGVPHRALEDDIYRGMLIPKDSTIVLNTRGMTLDESVYKDPTRFDPTRFLPAPAGRGEPYTTAMYGFGHRSGAFRSQRDSNFNAVVNGRKCPGRYLADNSLWVAIATILSTVSISPAIGVDGKEIIPEPIPVVTGISNQPKPFPCRIEPRSHLAARSLSQYLDSI
ncbi:hypothetical protein H0H87_004666 [Tephrocybe sp. NHM501043]|nr:hypothetical protein H0H87_004666 [Tephrocybe sp. NHM501043]